MNFKLNHTKYSFKPQSLPVTLYVTALDSPQWKSIRTAGRLCASVVSTRYDILSR